MVAPLALVQRVLLPARARLLVQRGTHRDPHDGLPVHPEIVRVPVDPPLHHVLDVHLGLLFPLPRGAIGEYPRRPEHVVEPGVIRELIGDAVPDTPARPRAPRLALSAIALASAHRSPAPNLAAKSLNVPSVRQLSEETLR